MNCLGQVRASASRVESSSLRRISCTKAASAAVRHDGLVSRRARLTSSLEPGRAVPPLGAHYELVAEDVSAELMARMQALSQTLRFRFAQGSTLRSPAELLERAMLSLGPQSAPAWAPYALSGTPVALTCVPGVDLLGKPRLDLMVHVPGGGQLHQHARSDPPAGLWTRALTEHRCSRPRRGDPGARQFGHRAGRDLDQVRCGASANIFLALLDAGLREQAYQYADGVRS